MTLHPYCGYEKDSRHECAVLVFAPNARTARTLAARSLASLIDAKFTAVRVKRLRDHLAFFESLRRGDEPHVIDNPPSCYRCAQWGEPIEHGRCASCREFDADDDDAPEAS